MVTDKSGVGAYVSLRGLENAGGGIDGSYTGHKEKCAVCTKVHLRERVYQS